MKNMPDDYELLQDWLRYANDNLRAAQLLIKEGEEAPYHAICFECHAGQKSI